MVGPALSVVGPVLCGRASFSVVGPASLWLGTCSVVGPASLWSGQRSVVRPAFCGRASSLWSGQLSVVGPAQRRLRPVSLAKADHVWGGPHALIQAFQSSNLHLGLRNGEKVIPSCFSGCRRSEQHWPKQQ